MARGGGPVKARSRVVPVSWAILGECLYLSSARRTGDVHAAQVHAEVRDRGHDVRGPALRTLPFEGDA
ncbi:hypothetical protein [Microbispora hainanensis]|uniref:Uncharacterized protein n=1 Tax=Microbispora hainanensis TaxID=568844 RepID=A0A544YZZ7_9ACTN|nr:hypothetical protein [Microbispora hainanensis]TQS22360.1 hypothetical protein FLX08_08180 [Microbispora hainanensis]